MALILVACSSPTDDSLDPDAARQIPLAINAFSHSSYTFAPRLPADSSIPSDGSKVYIASVFVNENEVKRLIARPLGIADDQAATAGLTAANYTLSYRINADSTSDANTFFSVAMNPDNPLQADISVSDPVGAGLSFAGILKLASRFQVEVTIGVPGVASGSNQIRSFVAVNFRERDESFALNTSIANIIEDLDNNITFTPEATINENNLITARASISGGVNLLNQYALVVDEQASQISLFWALRDTNNSAADACGNGDIYIDNQDLQIKAARTYNYEVESRPTYNCRLVVAEDGINYLPLAIAVSGNASRALRSKGLQIKGRNTPVAQGEEFILATDISSSVDCSTEGSSCYYADLDINITNVDELPIIRFAVPGHERFEQNEGVGALPAYEEVAGDPVDVMDNNLVNRTRRPVAQPLFVVDRDWDDETNEPLSIDVENIEIARVVPSHGTDAFLRFRFSGNSTNPHEYRLQVDGTKLDYERFATNELTADGKAIYKVFITATDHEEADGGGPQEFIQSFDFEVKDVIYQPLFVSSTNTSTTVLNGAAAFATESGIVSSGSTINLLSGSQALRNNLHRVGGFAAVDPETGDDRNLEYSIAASAALMPNFGLVDNSPRGQRLIIANAGLAPAANGPITLIARHKDLPTATNEATIAIAVNDVPYAAALDGRGLNSATPKFNQVIPTGEIAENTANDVVTYPNNANQLAGNYVTGSGLHFGFAPTSVFTATADFANLGRRFDNSKFDIDENTGVITAKDDSIEFNNPATYNLLVYVARAVDFNQVANEGGFLSTNPSDYDIAVIEVVVTDSNSAPVARGPDRLEIALNAPLTISVPENRAEAGAEVARITLTDDNGITTEDFDLTNARQTSPGLFNIEWQNARGSITGIVTLNRDLDYEADSGLNNQDYAFSITDKGAYFFNTTSRRVAPINPAAVATVGLEIDFTLENVNEAAQLELLTTSASVSESATSSTEITPANGGDALFRITNLQELDENSLTYTVEGAFNGILDVVERGRLGNSTSLALEVVNATRLENLGDGRTFIATLRVTDTASKLTSRINLPVMIINDFTQDFAITDDYLRELNINEQDVAEGNLLVGGFEIPATSLSRDYDDNFAANRRLQALNFDVIARPQNEDALDPNLPKFNAFEVTLSNDIYNLRILDRDLIDEALFGGLDLSISVRRGLAAADALASEARGMVVVTPATPKSIVYADATDAVLTPPVYSFNYTQTAYVAAVTRTSTQSITPAADIELDLNRISGLAADSFVQVDNEVYPTRNIRDENNRNYGNFISRVAGRSQLVSKNTDNAASPAVATPQTIIINLVLPAAVENVAEIFDILKEDDEGNLVDATTEFNNFFDVQLVTSASRAQLHISQNVFNLTNAEGEVTAENYNALDTIPLFAGNQTTQATTLNYFIRTYQAPRDTGNAANYALAQFSVAVRAAGDILPPPPIEYAVENLNIFPVAGQVNMTRFQWSNPASFIGTSITNLTLSIRSYNASAGDAGETLVQESILGGDNIKAGLHSLMRRTANDLYYELSITPNFRSPAEQGVAATSRRIFIGDIPPPTPPTTTPTQPPITKPTIAEYSVTNLRAEFLSSDAGTAQVNISWTNPAEFDTAISLAGITLVTRSYEAQGVFDRIVEETDPLLLPNINLSAGARYYVTTIPVAENLNYDYDFSLTPVLTVANEMGVEFRSNRIRLAPPTAVEYYLVETLAVNYDSGDTATLSWINPANFSTDSITELELTISNYSAATGAAGLETTTITIAATPATYTISSLVDGRYYEFTLTPVVDAAANQRSIAVTTPAPRILIDTPDTTPSIEYYLVENINVTTADNLVTINWTNPSNLTGSSIREIRIDARGYADASGGDAPIATADAQVLILNSQFLQDSSTIFLSTTAYYEFSFTLSFSDDNQKGIVVTTDVRSFIEINDRDADNDGLIEIDSASAFANISDELAPPLGNFCNDQFRVTACQGYELMANISLEGFNSWEPIGDNANSFSYVLEGNGYTISNLSITEATGDNVGLFSSLASAAAVRNLLLDNITIAVTGNRVGGLAGDLANATLSNVRLSNADISGMDDVGGLAGSMTNAYIVNVSVQGGLINASGSNAGGLFGSTSAGDIDTSLAELQSVYAGGNNTGGLIGLHDSATSHLYINATYASADLLESDSNTGGLIGQADGSGFRYLHIESSYTNIDTIKTGTRSSGGFIGSLSLFQQIKIDYSYSMVRRIDNPSSASAGGLIGNRTDIKHQPVILFSYWDNSTNFVQGDPFTAGPNADKRREGGQTSTSLQSGTDAEGNSLYENWDTTTRWHLGENTDYPVLRNLPLSIAAQRAALLPAPIPSP